MTTSEFFSLAAHQPFGSVACSNYRCIDGVFFIKAHGAWRVFAVIDGNVVVHPQSSSLVEPSKNRHTFRTSYNECFRQLIGSGEGKRVAVKYTLNNYADLPELEPKRRKIPDRSGLIRGLIYRAVTSRYDIDIRWDVWNLLWEYSLTLLCARIVHARQTVEASVNKIVFNSPLTQLTELLGQAHQHTLDEVYTEALSVIEKKVVPALNSGRELCWSVVEKVELARNSAKNLTVPVLYAVSSNGSVCEGNRLSHANELNRAPSYPHGLTPALILTSSNVVRDWAIFYKFLQRNDAFVADPFDLPLIPENVNKLAVLHETSKQALLDPLAHFEAMRVAREAPFEEAPASLGLAGNLI
jgi:hypothetical protein